MPIRLDFAKKDVAGTVFEGQKDLKLVTHCDNSGNGEQNVLTDHLPPGCSTCSRRARSGQPRQGGLRRPKRDKAPVPRYGILLENDEDVARRMEGRLYTVPNRLFNFIEPESLVLDDAAAVHDRNTDYSIMALHNVKLVRTVAA